MCSWLLVSMTTEDTGTCQSLLNNVIQRRPWFDELWNSSHTALVLVLCGQWMWKSREINCVLHLAIMYLSQKGKREHVSILTLKPCLLSNFFFSFFPIVAILSGTWEAGIALWKSSVPAKEKWVWAALEANLANPAACEELRVSPRKKGNTGYQTDWHSSAIKSNNA